MRELAVCSLVVNLKTTKCFVVEKTANIHVQDLVQVVVCVKLDGERFVVNYQTMFSCYCKLFKHIQFIVHCKLFLVDYIYQGEFEIAQFISGCLAFYEARSLI